MHGYLVLENGKVFKGQRFGIGGDVTAEVVFTTGMTGYLEILTDKSYAGQIVVQTFPLIGNYGVIPPDFEGGSVTPAGYVVKEWCQIPSNFRSEGNLDTFFVEQGVIALAGIDTRALTKVIREAGVLRGCITDNPENVDFGASIQGKVAQVSTKEIYTVQAENETYKVALLDCGVRNSICQALAERGASVTIYPHDTKAADILATKPDGIVIAGGPGNPTEYEAIVAEVKTLADAKIPLFGISLGHQLLALAHGYKIDTLHTGHRGSNQPVRHTETGKVCITGQNHRYVVDASSLDGQAKVLFEHVNDQSCEGLRYLDKPALSVQFYGGPKDTLFLFDDFIKLMEGQSHAIK
ncbi:MAG: carbamoyl phosphate synthase small subunit [Oscillospiraceae bacterium]|nr:carbamoyl phosphate synthase small subunit [Oscillospiraceae bacterium]